MAALNTSSTSTARTWAARVKQGKFAAQRDEAGTRLQRVREKLGLTQTAIGEVFSADKHHVYKMEAGYIRISDVRLAILLALELALQRHSPWELWGPTELTAPQRLARIFARAYPESL